LEFFTRVEAYKPTPTENIRYRMTNQINISQSRSV
jgi:hypothetical protein